MNTFFKLAALLVVAAWVGVAPFPGAREVLAHPADAGLNPPPDSATASSRLSTNTTEVIRLAEAAADEKLILAYIESAQTPFELSAEGIIYLKDLGIDESILTAMLRHDTTLRERGPQPGAAPPVTNQLNSVPTLLSPATNAAATAGEPVYVTNAPPDVVPFYEPLEPYGTWVELGGLGWCWQPQVVIINRSWRPYCHGGRWIYSDCGWYWHSDYSWGWAPFHYGRWQLHPTCGWVWLPDRVWGPAWVCWRHSDAYCGWAPLPPAAHFVVGQGFHFNHVKVGINFDFGLAPPLFTFVEIGHLHENHPHLHALPPTRVNVVYNRTTVINQYLVDRNNRVINQGIAVDRVAAASHRQIRPVMIKDAPAPAGGFVKPDRLEKVGSTTVLYRPELKVPSRRSPVVAQKVDERHAVIRRPLPQRVPISAPLAGGLPAVGKPAPLTPAAPAQSPARPSPRDAAVTPAPSPKGKPESPNTPRGASPAPRRAPGRRTAIATHRERRRAPAGLICCESRHHARKIEIAIGGRQK